MQKILHSRRLILINEFSKINVSPLSLPTFPHMGVGQYAITKEQEELTTDKNAFSESIYTIDSIINPHPRFPTLTKNIRIRRGKKVEIKIPLFIDKNTSIEKTDLEPFPNSIYMDSMAFGMGSCCLQATFETVSINHGRFLHDQLLVFGPILGALSASTPIFKGKLANVDFRWNLISQSVDCRTPEELNPNSPKYLSKSRYSAMYHYISNHEYVSDKDNDTGKMNDSNEYMEMMKQAGIDDRLAYHVASLFARDPLVIYDKGIVTDDSKSTMHFENLQSTNWNSLRFKPPPSLDSDVGWRVEFRTIDSQITDFENAAQITLLFMLVKIISEFDLNFIIPISKCDDNMERAHSINAVKNEKFWFRINILGSTSYQKTEPEKFNFLKNSEFSTAYPAVISELTINQILEGDSELGFKGLIPLIIEYMEIKNYLSEDKTGILMYLNFLRDRACGKCMSTATLIRKFVTHHPDYKFDSIISSKIKNDLIKLVLNFSFNDDPQIYYKDPCPQDIKEFNPEITVEEEKCMPKILCKSWDD